MIECLPLLQDAAGAVGVVDDTVTGLSHTAEKLTLAGLLLIGNVVQAYVLRAVVKRYFKLIDEQRAEYKARADADAAAKLADEQARRDARYGHPPTTA